VHPPQGLRTVGAVVELVGECVEEPAHPLDTLGLDVGDGLAVDAGGALVGGHVDPRSPLSSITGNSPEMITEIPHL
jgi:hypothetical protein